MPVLLLQKLNKLVKSGRLFILFKTAVVKAHGLSGLTVALYGIAVYKMLSYAVSHIGGEGLGKFEIALFYFAENDHRFFCDFHGKHTVGHFKRCVEIILFCAVGRAPVAQPYGKKSPLVLAGIEVFEIFCNVGNGIFGRRCFTRVGHNVVGNEGQRLIPGGTVAPVESPAARWNYTGKAAVLLLGKAKAAQPEPKALFGLIIHKQLFGRKAYVCRPSVFLPLRAIGGEIMKV